MQSEERIIREAFSNYVKREYNKFSESILDKDIDSLYGIFEIAYRVGYAKGHADSTTIRSKDYDKTNNPN
jgi:hypothetical protein